MLVKHLVKQLLAMDQESEVVASQTLTTGIKLHNVFSMITHVERGEEYIYSPNEVEQLKKWHPGIDGIDFSDAKTVVVIELDAQGNKVAYK